ncbi:hypothetical protein CLOM621_07185 [Clostridium sp. M62/1]|nr:hypothetical protein CLOM621_07185 [Clostridium sp. M62/1]
MSPVWKCLCFPITKSDMAVADALSLNQKSNCLIVLSLSERLL